MSRGFVVSGTDTDIGKTVFAAALTHALGGVYFKPVQAGKGPDGCTDTDTVRRLSGLGESHFLAELYRLDHALSPHRAAELDGTAIDPARLVLPRVARPLIVEGAGGLMVPLSRRLLFIDVFAQWGAPVILCARTALGTLNHTLLSLEALRRRGIPVHGVAFIGDANPDNERTIAEMGGVRRLGRLPWLGELSPASLSAAFASGFDRADFGGPA
jgi:dethiobiotin synthetase